MAHPRNIFAHTALGIDAPHYVSMNVVDGEIQITVRSPKETGGATACAPLSRNEVEAFADALNAYLAALP